MRGHISGPSTIDELPQGTLEPPSGQRIVVVPAPDGFAAEQPQVVAVTPEAGLGLALHEQVQQNRGEHGAIGWPTAMSADSMCHDRGQ